MIDRIKTVLRGAEQTRRVLTAAALFLFSVATGLFALALAACSYAPLYHPAVLASYFDKPLIVVLNVLPAVLLIALGYFLTQRPWAAYLISAVPTVGFALANYFLIQLRGDPLIAADLKLIRAAGAIVWRYQFDITRVVLIAVGGSGLLFLASLALPKGKRSPRLRVCGTLVCLALIPLLYSQVYMSPALYRATVNNTAIHNEWSEVEVFVSRGFWYPFIRSVSKAFPSPPEGYSAREADALLAQYGDADIPPEQRVDVVGVMCESLADLTDFPALAEQKSVRELYAPLHELEARSVSGDLLTNIFAGGTVDSEWGFLTGSSLPGDFRTDTASYVRYFSAQGYETVYRHPGYGWFYNRRNVNRYLGFDGSVFTEDGFGELVDPRSAPHRSDKQLFDFLLGELSARTADQPPLFSFSVTYQNHGPYDDQSSGGIRPLSPEATGWSAESCNILNNYLDGVSDTLTELSRFVDALERLDRPVVLVLFGDHKPWLGNDAAVYKELGVDLSAATTEGFYNYYSAPYFIWANSAAKAVLDRDFTGRGGDFSPCFLMTELFDLCGWEGPGFLRLSRGMRALTPLLHEQDLFIEDGALTDSLSPEAQAYFLRYRAADYRRMQKRPT